MNGSQLTPEAMQNMSKMMGDMAGMMKHMFERMKMGTNYEI
jgi:hypothetical protein